VADRQGAVDALGRRVEELRGALASRDAAVAEARDEAEAARARAAAAEDDAAAAHLDAEEARKEAALGRAALKELDHLREQLRDTEAQVDRYRAEAAAAAVAANRAAAATRLTERNESYRCARPEPSKGSPSPAVL